MKVTSRVARKPVVIPKGVDIKLQDQLIMIKGPKGELAVKVHPHIHIAIDDANIKIQDNVNKIYCRSGIERRLKTSIAGTVRAQVNNAVEGVLKGFERKLILVGVGYRAQAKGKILSLTLGYSHPVEFPVPEGITIETPSLTEVIVKGIDRHLVGHTASMIRSLRSPEFYKGKGIRYANEVIILKETKKK